MRTSRQNHAKQLEFCLESTHLTSKHSNLLIALNGDNQGRIDHMTKFKSFHEFQKPLIGFTPESFPHLHEDKFRLRRDGNTPRTSLQISKRGRIFIRYSAHRSEVFLFRSTYVSSEVTVKFIILWICYKSSQQ